ncbi:MAG: dihydroorotate dehydrogenase catalytic subunit [Candidatus Atribacteria bacterium]|nr:dihydroorotate dehydrogenase catalytic subunit [Candidatus Atribacteria bacterium]
MVDLSVHLGSLTLQNPVVLASGTCGYGREIALHLDLNQVGALTIKGLSYDPWPGNPPPRIRETYAGVLNSIGLENKGVQRFLKEDLPFLERLNTKILVNIWGSREEEYLKVAQILAKVERVDGVELNVSCPNVEKGGLSFSCHPEVLRQLAGKVREIVKKPLVVKLGPQVPDWEATIRVLEIEGVDIISLTNSFPAVSVDIEAQNWFFARKVAGLSGPAIKPLALKLLYDVRKLTNLPLIGMGGIIEAEDALEFILLGATAVGIGTANLVSPTRALNIVWGIEEYLEKKKVPDLGSLVGKVV